MTWNTLADINSVSIDDLNEYMSRPDERVLELIGKRGNQDIVFYGATGKWMSDLTEMLLRAIRETGTTGRKLHLVSRFSRMEEFDSRFSQYSDLYQIHKVDLLKLRMTDLQAIPADNVWVLYGIGYKFRTNETSEEYTRLCNYYGNVIPSLAFSHHRFGGQIVVIGSGNGLPPTPVDNQAAEDTDLCPSKDNCYGNSIKDKEITTRTILDDGDPASSKAVILRGMYMTNFTYGGLEPIVYQVLNNKAVDIGNLGAFNLISHRDANIHSIMAVEAASNPVSVLHLSGSTVKVDEAVQYIADKEGLKALINGKLNDKHLLADDSKIKRLFGPNVDTLEQMLEGQVFWIKNKGKSINLNHKVGVYL